MPSLSQSPILQALGYAIANSLWQMALVWIVYVLLNSVFKFKSEIKYRIAVAAQIVGFGWFIVTLQFYYQQCSQALEVAEALYLQTGNENTFVVASEKGSLLSYFTKAEQVLPYLSVAYLLLLAFLTIRWFSAYRYTQLVRLNGLHKIDVDWKLFVTKVAGQLGIKQKIRIYLSEIVQSPVTIGFLKPVILVPIASINHLTPQQMEAVILHELAHIKRHDYILNIVLSIIELGLFFNPFTRLITKSISKERENSCDDWVLQYQYNPSMYAEALLRIAVMQQNPTMAMYAVKTKSELLSRVQRMVHQKDSRFNYRHQLLALLLMTGILSSIAWFDPAKLREQDTIPTEANHAVVIEPLAAKIDNPLFNPLSFLNEPLKEEVKQTVAANQKEVNKNRKLRTAYREIQLPNVMAPVAIENLKELERNLASIHKDVRKGLVQWNNMKIAQNHLFKFDTLRFGGNITFTDDSYWHNITEELKNSQKVLEDALRRGKISRINAKKMQAEITQALEELKEIKMPQFFGFAPGAAAGTEFFYTPGFANEIEEREKTKSADEKRKAQQNASKINVLKRKREAMADSIHRRYVVKATTRTPLKTGTAYSALTEGSNQVIVNGQYDYVKTISGTPSLKIGTLPYLHNNQGVTAYNYVYTESEDDCEKANRNERSRRIILAPTVKGKIKGTASKPKRTTVKRIAENVQEGEPCSKEAETMVIHIEFE